MKNKNKSEIFKHQGMIFYLLGRGRETSVRG